MKYLIFVGLALSFCIQANALATFRGYADTLEAIATIDYPAKCGRPTGKISIAVSGGSGQYGYSLGGPVISSLPAGPGFCVIFDLQSGAFDTAFFNIPNVLAEAKVDLELSQPLCFGQTGNASFNLIPGNNFTLPFTFAITTSGGIPVSSPGALAIGDYVLHIADADSCLLPALPFSIQSPPPLALQAATTDANCNTGGAIQIQVTGGTAPYFADWGDLTGVNNIVSRNQLLAGNYQLTVYDSLFCKDSLTSIRIKPLCVKKDTFHLLVKKGESNTFCLPLPVGFSVSESTFNLISGNFSAFGNWTLTNNCLNYQAFSTTGINIDHINIKTSTPSLQSFDTVCISISILPDINPGETVYFTAKANTPTAACGALPGSLQNRKIIPLNVPAVTGQTGFGIYQVELTGGCFNYTPFSTPQFFADSIAFAIIDTINLENYTLRYVPSILPETACRNEIFNQATLIASTPDCYNGAEFCINIPYLDIVNYSVLDNGIPYSIGATPCLEQSVFQYSVTTHPTGLNASGGPYKLEAWILNGVTKQGVFSNLAELIILMNQFDPTPGWFINTNGAIVGGNFNHTYGQLRTSNAAGQTGQSMPQMVSAALGSVLQFATGEHLLIAKKIQTGCADTLVLKLLCSNCPDIHNHPMDADDTILFTTFDCSSDTLVSTSIPVAAQDEWEITQNNVEFKGIEVENGNLSLRIDTGFFEINFYNTITTCKHILRVDFQCKRDPSEPPIEAYTGISPNGDGKNDEWHINGIEQFPNNEVWVFNSSGLEVFHQKNYDNTWSGNWNKGLLPDGVYFFVIDLGNESRLYKGTLTIHR